MCNHSFPFCSEPLLDGCDDKEATKFSMETLKLGEEVEMNVINIWSCILNDLEKKRDLTTPSSLFMLCDQSVNASKITLFTVSYTHLTLPTKRIV